MAAKPETTSDLRRRLPSIDSLLQTDTAKELQTTIGVQHLGFLARKVTEELRQEIMTHLDSAANPGDSDRQYSRVVLLEEAEKRLVSAHTAEMSGGIRRVINATGVIVHTNLGRAPLSDAALRALGEHAGGYCTLEYDTLAGARGRRGARVEDLVAELTGAEAAVVVNNCAAAALLVLTVLARDGETIVSRGELVEIGGDFRVPDVMAQSGTRMIEVGTTNRTRLSDYARALSDKTRLVMRVHTSNYRIIGFTKTPTTRELADLAHERGMILYEDAGSGALIDLAEFGISGEPVIHDSINDGADVVSFSGDKLMGGPQAGFLVGQAKIIERMRTHPLYRALRVDKLRLAAIEATLDAYTRGVTPSEIPAHHALTLSADKIKTRAENFIERLSRHVGNPAFQFELVSGSSAVGGGAAPTSPLPTTLISVAHRDMSANQIESQLRHSTPPVISRIENHRVMLDLRTVSEAEEPGLERALISLLTNVVE